jgi:hypothetical protein
MREDGAKDKDVFDDGQFGKVTRHIPTFCDPPGLVPCLKGHQVAIPLKILQPSGETFPCIRSKSPPFAQLINSVRNMEGRRVDFLVGSCVVLATIPFQAAWNAFSPYDLLSSCPIPAILSCAHQAQRAY